MCFTSFATTIYVFLIEFPHLYARFWTEYTHRYMRIESKNKKSKSAIWCLNAIPTFQQPITLSGFFKKVHCTIHEEHFVHCQYMIQERHQIMISGFIVNRWSRKTWMQYYWNFMCVEISPWLSFTKTYIQRSPYAKVAHGFNYKQIYTKSNWDAKKAHGFSYKYIYILNMEVIL